MIKSWEHAKNILIIRADNMGDLIMSSPAIRALKQTFSSRITVLTSSMASGITPFIAEIDDVIIFDLPWVKAKEANANEDIFDLVTQLKERKFDAAVIFTVFSQNALPAAMITYLAGIPLRLGYSRENPYRLLTNWVPDKEPYTFIQHQVKRDLALVKSVGAAADNIYLNLNIPETAWEDAQDKLSKAGVDIENRWLIFHAGVSERKREYPQELWVAAARKLIKEKGFQIIFTGVASEKNLCGELTMKTGENAFSAAGLLNLKEFIAVIKHSLLTVSVNTGTIHIAAAVNTPVVVLYAQTNPQHTPWMVPCKVLEFEVEEENRSRNEVVRFLYKEVYNKPTAMPGADEIYQAVNSLLG
jgi:lipopolysaccharide heptosyltransferase II